MSIISCQQYPFGTLETGETITCYSLRNTSGMAVNLLNYGATLQAIQIPDSRGKMHEIIQGFSQLEEYTRASTIHPGAVFAHLPPRYGTPLSQLHRMIWSAKSITDTDAASVEFTLEGVMDLPYPYDKTSYQFNIRYTLTSADELIIQSYIETGTSLPIFITHHPAWNLSGTHAGDIKDHVLQVWATHYSSVDNAGFLSHQHNTIADKTAFDFREPQRIGERWSQLPPESTYNICFVRNTPHESTDKPPCTLAARVKAPISGRTLEVYSTQPGLRFYLDTAPDTQTLQGLSLIPLPLLKDLNTSASHLKQETRYKLIW